MKRDWLGVALAGGRSSRMGEDKSGMALREGTTQLEYIMGLLSVYCSSVAVSVRLGQMKGIHWDRIEDAEGIEGPMAGAIAALRAAAGRPALLVACDMPFVDRSVLLQLAGRRDPAKVATCFIGADGRPEPLCAVYEPSSLPLLERDSTAGKLGLRRFLESESVERIRLARPNLLASVNTPSEARVARGKLR